VNQSTVTFIQVTLAHQTRHRCLSTATKLRCPICNEVRMVRDVFPNGEVKLECGHRRPLAYRKREDVAAYDAAIAAKNNGVAA
jgi:hypothetical protein